jgi:saccharopine dehydrogenase (NAD+, L-lysine-forming)
MKAIVLGGYGVMGASVARDLIKGEQVTKVILAGRRIHTENLHSSVQASGKVSSEIVDVTDFHALVEAIRGSDVVINCVGPYFKYGINTIKAAIEAGVNYVDICDDHAPISEAFTLDEAAKRAGITVCVGFGAGPGITNVIAKYAADKLDEVEEIREYWVVGYNDPSGPAAMPHSIHMLEGNVPQFIDGQWVEVPGNSGVEEVEFLAPVGKCEVYYVGHPEPVTLPRYIKKGLKTVTVKGGWLPPLLNDLIRDLLNSGLTTTEDVKLDGSSITLGDLVTPIARAMMEIPDIKKDMEKYTSSPANLIVKGKQGSNEVTYTYRLMGKSAPGVGIAASTVAQMMYRGEVKVKGVVAPEGAVEPEVFFSLIAKRGFWLDEEKTVRRAVTFQRSW